MEAQRASQPGRGARAAGPPCRPRGFALSCTLAAPAGSRLSWGPPWPLPPTPTPPGPGRSCPPVSRLAAWPRFVASSGSRYCEPPRGELEAGAQAGEGASRDARAGNACGDALWTCPLGGPGRTPALKAGSRLWLCRPGGPQPLGPLRSQITGACHKQRNIFKVKKKKTEKKISHPSPHLHWPLSPRGAAGAETALDPMSWSPTASSHQMLHFGHLPGLFLLNPNHSLFPTAGETPAWRLPQPGMGAGSAAPLAPGPRGASSTPSLRSLSHVPGASSVPRTRPRPRRSPLPASSRLRPGHHHSEPERPGS